MQIIEGKEEEGTIWRSDRVVEKGVWVHPRVSRGLHYLRGVD